MCAHRALPMAASLALLVGCAPATNVDDPDAVRVWANSASPVAVFLQVYTPVAQSYAQPDVYADPACPTIADDGTTLVITGACTDSTGQRWFGTARVVRTGPSDRDVTLDDFGSGSDTTSSRATGTAAIRDLGADRHSFEVHLVVDSSSRTIIDYEGTVEGYYGDAATTWSGQGTVRREGMVAPTGLVTATTVDQRLDSSCSGESASGTTTLDWDGHVIGIAYDGATDCDADHSARWSFDGQDRGFVSGISCAASPVGAAGGAGAGGALLLALRLWLWRRRAVRGASAR